MLKKILIRDRYVRFFAIGMVFIGTCLFVSLPFLKVKSADNLAQPKIAKICCVDNKKVRDWQYIVLHHSGTREGNATDFDNYHRKKRGWKFGLAYHFVIGNGSKSGDGMIEVGQRWKNQIHGAHTSNMDLNRIAIGICLVGNFEKQEYISAQQFNSMAHLVTYLCKRYNIPLSNVIAHYQIKKGHTVCPGKHFPMDELKTRLAEAGI